MDDLMQYLDEDYVVDVFSNGTAMLFVRITHKPTGLVEQDGGKSGVLTKRRVFATLYKRVREAEHK